jgi:hypothetical protein
MSGPATIPSANRPGHVTAPDGAPAKTGAPAKSQPAVTPGSLAAWGPHEREDKAVFDDIYKLGRASARRLGAENGEQSQNAEGRAPDALAKDQFRDHIAKAFAACPYRPTPFMHANVASPEDEFILRQQAFAQLSAISKEYNEIKDPAVKIAAREDSNYRRTIYSGASWLAGSPKRREGQDYQHYKENLILRARAVADDPNIDPDIKKDFLNSLAKWVKTYGVDLQFELKRT